MKINYLNDIHLEFGLLMHELEGEVLVLAGDVHTKGRNDWINEAAKYFGDVVYVLGNHEYYQRKHPDEMEKYRKGLASNVHLLENESVTINGVTFHGGTLWNNMDNGNPIVEMAVEYFMNDFRVIRTNGGKRRFTPLWARHLHSETVRYFKKNVKPGDIVVTHHAPSFLSIHPDYPDFKTNCGFASDFKPQLWFHGHVHNSFDYTIGDTRILCNPRGYTSKDLNPDFDVNAFVEIEK
jgi:Icc-related predicted phosphoesterase